MIKEIYKILFSSNKSAFFKSLLLDKNGKYAFIEIPKSGCSTVKRALLYLEETEYSIESQRTLHKNEGFVSFGDDKFSRAAWLTRDKVFSFSLVRNPYTRILSAYLEKIEYGLDSDKYKRELFELGEKVSFISFLKKIKGIESKKLDRHFMLQTHILGKFYKEIHIGYLESIDQDLKRMLQEIFPDRGCTSSRQAPHSTNSSKKQTMLNYYDLEAINMVKEIYKDDFYILGYSDRFEDAPLEPNFPNKILFQNEQNTWKFYLTLQVLIDSNIRKFLKKYSV